MKDMYGVSVQLYCPKCDSTQIETKKREIEPPGNRVSMDTLSQEKWRAFQTPYIASCVDCGYTVEFFE